MWNDLIKKVLLTVIGLTLLILPNEAGSGPHSPGNRNGATRRRRQAEVRPEQKLAHFKRQISRTPDSKITPEQKRLYIECLDMLASCPRGLWIIQNAPL